MTVRNLARYSSSVKSMPSGVMSGVHFATADSISKRPCEAFAKRTSALFACVTGLCQFNLGKAGGSASCARCLAQAGYSYSTSARTRQCPNSQEQRSWPLRSPTLVAASKNGAAEASFSSGFNRLPSILPLHLLYLLTLCFRLLRLILHLRKDLLTKPQWQQTPWSPGAHVLASSPQS